MDATIQSLKLIQEPRFFETERGFQGQFNTVLQDFLIRRRILPGKYIVEEEYQKTTKHHGSSLRPDIIIHRPSVNPRKNNLCVYAFKRRASVTAAQNDFKKLQEMLDKLDYEIAVFINIDSKKHYLGQCLGKQDGRIHAFAIWRINRRVNVVHAGWKGGRISKSTYRSVVQ